MEILCVDNLEVGNMEIDTDAVAEVFKALGHPARLKMVNALAEGEMCVCHLQELVGLDVSTVSKHLTVLKNAGVVSARRQGTWMHYALEMRCVAGFMRCVQHASDSKK